MKVVSGKNQRGYLPFFQTLTLVLALSHFHAPEWLWGALAPFVILWWIAGFIKIYKQEETDVFKDKIDLASMSPEVKSRFQQKLEEAMQRAHGENNKESN